MRPDVVEGAEAAGGLAPRAVTLAALFLGFLEMGLSGFGGVLPWCRRVIVERRRWLAPEEFAALLGLCQFLPGPNVVNLAVALGSRFQGWRGALVCVAGLLGAPFLIVLGLGLLYSRYGDLPGVMAAIRGMSAVAVGLTVATGLKMVAGLGRVRAAHALALAMFVGCALFRLPLLVLLLLVVTPGFAIAMSRES